MRDYIVLLERRIAMDASKIIKIAGLACSVAGMILGGISQSKELRETVAKEVTNQLNK